MGAIPQVRKTGPKSYPAVELITGGKLVEARANGTGAGVAAAASVRCLGVAIDDAINEAAQSLEPVTVNGRPTLNASPLPTRVAAARGEELPVTYAAAANFGDKLICAANGQVTPAGAAPDARTIVGQCQELGGVAAGAVGKTWIF